MIPQSLVRETVQSRSGSEMEVWCWEGLLLPGQAAVVREGAPDGKAFELDFEEHAYPKKGGEIMICEKQPVVENGKVAGSNRAAEEGLRPPWKALAPVGELRPFPAGKSHQRV